jgi:hypothetical protein
VPRERTDCGEASRAVRDEPLRSFDQLQPEGLIWEIARQWTNVPAVRTDARTRRPSIGARVSSATPTAPNTELGPEDAGAGEELTNDLRRHAAIFASAPSEWRRWIYST